MYAVRLADGQPDAPSDSAFCASALTGQVNNLYWIEVSLVHRVVSAARGFALPANL